MDKRASGRPHRRAGDFLDYQDFLDQYFKHKAEDPSLGATSVLPRQESKQWWSRNGQPTKSWNYPMGTDLFTAPAEGQGERKPWPNQVGSHSLLRPASSAFFTANRKPMTYWRLATFKRGKTRQSARKRQGQPKTQLVVSGRQQGQRSSRLQAARPSLIPAEGRGARPASRLHTAGTDSVQRKAEGHAKPAAYKSQNQRKLPTAHGECNGKPAIVLIDRGAAVDLMDA